MAKVSKKNRMELSRKRFKILRSLLPKNQSYLEFANRIIDVYEGTYTVLPSGKYVKSEPRTLTRDEIINSPDTMRIFLCTDEGDLLTQKLGLQLYNIGALKAIILDLPEKMVRTDEPDEEVVAYYSALFGKRHPASEKIMLPVKYIDLSQPTWRIVGEIEYLKRAFGPINPIRKKRGKKIDDLTLRVMNRGTKSLLKVSREDDPKIRSKDPNQDKEAKNAYAKAQRAERKLRDLKDQASKPRPRIKKSPQ